MRARLFPRFIFLAFLIFSGCNDNNGPPRARKAHILVEKPRVWSRINKVIVVVLENTGLDEAKSQPFLREMTNRGAYLSNYSALTHPSQPNYVGLIAGQVFQVSSDDNYDLSGSHIGDSLERAGKTWKSYAEGLPSPCYLGAASGSYYRKHEPFMSFENVQRNSARCNQVVNASQFQTDLRNQNLPNFSLYIPDINNDGHDTGIAFADRWFAGFFNSLAWGNSYLNDTLLVLTFDEGPNGGDNKILTLFYGLGVHPGAVSGQDYDHYSLLRTFEEIFNLPTLATNDAAAPAIDDIWIR